MIRRHREQPRSLALRAACVVCHSMQGSPCTDAAGRPRRRAHRARVEAARAAREITYGVIEGLSR